MKKPTPVSKKAENAEQVLRAKRLRADARREAQRRLQVSHEKSVLGGVNSGKVRREIAEDAHERELLGRELARRRLLAYIQKMDPKYLAGWVHKDICARVERFVTAVEEGKDPRLMLWVPPRTGKSTIASQRGPEWILGKHPDWEIISASYAVSLPLEFSRRIRATLRSTEYNAIFSQTVLDPDNQNAEGWKTTRGGGFLPAGVGGGITGKGAVILNIDDPFKDAEEADSQLIRDKVFDWYSSTAYTRLAPKSGVLIIQTRWHDDDLSGRLVQMMRDAEQQAEEARASGDEELAESILSEIDRWEIVMYPALATQDEHLAVDGQIFDHPKPECHTVHVRSKGEALHPERYSRQRLLKIKKTLMPRHWSALYQQNPVPEDGLYFKKADFRYYFGAFPWEVFPIYSAWDLAIGQRQQNDWTVGIAAAMDYEGRLNVLEVVRARLDTLAIVEAMLAMYVRYKNAFGSYLMGIEHGQLKLALAPVLNREMRERRLFIPMADSELLMPVTDKVVRARPLQGLYQQGMIVHPHDSTQIQQVEQELLRFPGGVFDDCVDAMSWLARMTQNQAAPKPPKKKQLKSWKDTLGQYITGSKHFMAA